MKIHEATEQAYKNGYKHGYEDGMIKGTKWQPIGEQFEFACRVCFYLGSCGEECRNCKCEKKPGFVFDPDKFIKLCKEMNKERYWYNASSGELIRLDKKELDEIKKDRDFWKGIADRSLQAIVSIAERLASYTDRRKQ